MQQLTAVLWRSMPDIDILVGTEVTSFGFHKASQSGNLWPCFHSA